METLGKPVNREGTWARAHLGRFEKRSFGQAGKEARAPGKFPGCAPTLTGKLAPWMRRLIEQPTLAKQWVDTYGSPVHAVVTSEFRRNVRDLLAPIQERGLSGGLFFARKANKLPWFVTAAKEERIGVDTASLQEVEETIALGLDPKKIIITAIGKEAALVSKAIAAECILVIDNFDELEVVKQIARAMEKKARIGLRLSGFSLRTRVVFSRFGFALNDWPELLNKVSTEPFLGLELLHAHLDRYDPEERAAAGRVLIELTDSARHLGNSVEAIDLGGGILIRYLDKQEHWENFQTRLIDSLAAKSPSFTFLDDGLGYYLVDDQVLGNADLYPAWNNASKERFISAVLDNSDSGKPLHKELSERGLNLYFEPGRALLDNTGVTLCKVAFRKRDTLGNLLIGTAMNRMNLRPFRAEFCVDPILLEQREPLDEGVFLVGNLCSESDLIFRRRLKLASMPNPGDIVCFPNTAGYLAHHMEIGTHGNPIPNNVLIDPDTWEINASA